jgi:hypothetical protein
MDYRTPMELILVVPGMLGIAAAKLAAMRTLERLAQFAAPPRTEPHGIAAALLAILHPGRDAPVAPLAMLGAGGDPRDDFVLCADPVHLAADRDTVVLVQRIDDLSENERDALIRTLDRHFAADDLRFEALRSDAWFARLTHVPDVRLAPLDAVLRRPLFSHLPAGADARRWRAWQNEIQMLLHEHAVNIEREARGQPGVTGLWFWGAGRLRDVAAMRVRHVAAAAGPPGDLARGIARHAGASATALAAGSDLAQALTSAGVSSQDRSAPSFMLVVTPPNVAPDALEAAWLAPALARLAHRDIERLHVVADGNGTAAAWSAATPTLWRRIASHAARRPFDAPQPA